MADKENLFRGALFSLFAFFCMAAFGAFVKAADSALWANFLAFVSGLLILFCIVLRPGTQIFKTEHFGLHFCRAFFGIAASIAYVCAIDYIPLLDATLLYNATPLFIPIFSIFLLKCKVERLTWIAILVGYIGVAFIIRPSSHILAQSGDFLGLGSGILLALAFTFVKLLTRTESFFKIVFYYFFLATLLQLPFLSLFGPYPSTESILYSCAAGISLLLAQLGIAKSYSFAPASKVGIFQYSSVVFIGIIDWIVWGITPNLFEVLGTLIVILAGVLIITRNRPIPQK